LSDEHGFRLLAAGARFYLGLAEVAGGQPNYAMAPSVRSPLGRETQGLTSAAETIFLSWLAVAQALAGNTADALKTVERALQASPTDYARPEAMRIRGELRLSQQQTEAAEADFRDSIALAQKQGAKAWELRSAISLARLLKERGERTAAQDLLAPIYGWFTEGFDTADLKDARALLNELNNRA
jgi:predicted ATPase